MFHSSIARTISVSSCTKNARVDVTDKQKLRLNFNVLMIQTAKTRVLLQNTAALSTIKDDIKRNLQDFH